LRESLVLMEFSTYWAMVSSRGLWMIARDSFRWRSTASPSPASELDPAAARRLLPQ
jgi:hypothetical protein